MDAAELPSELGGRFSVAQARAVGVSVSRLRRRDLERPFHGVRSTVGAAGIPNHNRLGRELGNLERAHLVRVHEYDPWRGPDAFYSHVTAAVAWSVPIPPWILRDALVHVAVRAPRRLPRSRGVRGHQVLDSQTVTCTDSFTGLRLADPATTWAMLGSMLTHPYDLVAAGDAIIREWRVAKPLATLERLRETTLRGRRVGIITLRDAIPRLRTRSASRMETWMRLTIVDGGLPEPELNAEVWEDGDYLGTVDGAYVEAKIAVEYESEHHLRDPTQWAYDIERYDRMRTAGWIVIRATKGDLFTHPARFVAKVRAALAARG